MQLYILTGPADSVDLVFVRDLLFHLINIHIVHALHKICESAIRSNSFLLLCRQTGPEPNCLALCECLNEQVQSP